MNIFKNRVCVDAYLKANRFIWMVLWSTDKQTEEYKENEKIVKSYNRQNRLNIFRFFNERYRPYIKYGNYSRWSGKMLYTSLILFMISMSVLFFNKDVFMFLYIINSLLLFGSVFLHGHYRDKYDKEKKIYQEAKKKPNWLRIQKLESILAD